MQHKSIIISFAVWKMCTSRLSRSIVLHSPNGLHICQPVVDFGQYHNSMTICVVVVCFNPSEKGSMSGVNLPTHTIALTHRKQSLSLMQKYAIAHIWSEVHCITYFLVVVFVASFLRSSSFVRCVIYLFRRELGVLGFFGWAKIRFLGTRSSIERWSNFRWLFGY